MYTSNNIIVNTCMAVPYQQIRSKTTKYKYTFGVPIDFCFKRKLISNSNRIFYFILFYEPKSNKSKTVFVEFFFFGIQNISIKHFFDLIFFWKLLAAVQRKTTQLILRMLLLSRLCTLKSSNFSYVGF